MFKIRSTDFSIYQVFSMNPKVLAIVVSFIGAALIHIGPMVLMRRVDPLLHIETTGCLILASLCLAHTAVLSLPGKPGTWIGVSSLILSSIFTLFNIIHIQLFKGPLSFIAMASTVHSNTQEVDEFLNAYGSTIWGTACIYLPTMLAYTWGYLKTRPTKTWTLATWPFFLALIFMTPIAYRSWDNPKKTLWTIHEYAYIDRFLACVLRYKQVLEGQANAQTFLEKRDPIKKDLLIETDQGDLPVPLVIVVIGESTSRGHMGVYGYRHQTTPRMHALRDRLVFFSDTISPVANTIPAVLNALCADAFDTQTWHCDSPNLLELAQTAGYKTSWISNQSPTGFGENMISILGQTANTNVFVNRQVASGGETSEHISLDEKVLPPLREKLEEFRLTGQPQMLFIHLMGTHFTYERRYPRSKAHPFRPSIWPADEKKDQTARTIIHHYDNAVSYQDTVLGEIFGYLYRSPSNALFFYFSDHGEEVFDTDDFYGHNDDRLTPAMREIPFVVGFSRGLQENHPDMVRKIQQSKERPFTIAKLTLSIVDLLGVSYPGMPRQESIFSPDFTASPRMTFSGPYKPDLN
jgi:heptose-I-phosphate ethanolaminephosphotransferase